MGSSLPIFRHRSIARDLAFSLTCIIILVPLVLSFTYQLLAEKKLVRTV
jgi:hypothetical protein